MAKDIFHDAVVTALQNEGWTITHDPLKIKIEGLEYQIDLGAEMLIGAERENEKIAVEIKSFVGHSRLHDLHGAMGQFVNYYVALQEDEPDRVLFLAIPEHTHRTLFSKSIIQKTLAFVNAKVLVYDAQSKTIVQWIK
jgi:hypothetical protein